MTIEKLRSAILASQASSGAFPSIAHLPGGPVADENAFVTALVIEQLSMADMDPEIAGACERGAGFLFACQQSTRAFSFYPANAQPAWLGEFLPPDADDTALCSLALFRSGLWPRSSLRRQVFEVLERYRLQTRPRGAEWYRAGIYPTWLDSRRLHNPIDVCANVNVLTLIEVSGAGSLHGKGILEMVAAALDWAGDNPERVRLIMPYYPQPAELGYALERAVLAGVRGADSLLGRVRKQPWNSCDDSVDAPVCSSLGGLVVWTSPVLHAVRNWVRRRRGTLRSSHGGGGQDAGKANGQQNG